MSNTCSTIDWIEQVLFGTANVDTVPQSVRHLVARLEADGIRWRDGNLVEFPYQVHGDLNLILDHLDKNNVDECPVFKTRSVRIFYLEFMKWLACRMSRYDIPEPKMRDREILESILNNQPVPIDSYESASFWGETTRMLLNHRRPAVLNRLQSLDTTCLSDRLEWLYELTCQNMGQVIDPLTTAMVPTAKYIDASIWQSGASLEAFVVANPDNILSKSIQDLVDRNLHQLFKGTRPSCSNDRIVNTFLHNISVVDESIRNVHDESRPPKTIDVFQRLLALIERDYLWKQEDLQPVEITVLPEHLLGLMEKLHLVERQNRILLDACTGK